jgi:hypothetical protein
MPYPHVNQLETRLSLDRAFRQEAHCRASRRRRSLWIALLEAVDMRAARNVGGSC